MATPKVEIDTTNFNAAMRQLAQLTGNSRHLQKVIRAEARMIYQGALTKTGPKRAESRQKIAEAHTLIEGNGVARGKRLIKTLRIGGRTVATKSIFRKGAYVTNPGGGRFWDQDADNPDWPLAQAKLKKLRLLRQARVGLAKWSWVRMAETAGLQPLPRVPAYVFKAGASVQVAGQKFTQKFFSIARGSRSGFAIDLQQAAGNQFGAKTRTAFLKAMHGRTGYFHRNLKAGVFQDANARTAKYGFLNELS